jgi:hypothetical protein
MHLLFALKYLEFQKRIKKSYIRENSNYKADWSTSIFLSTERTGQAFIRCSIFGYPEANHTSPITTFLNSIRSPYPLTIRL